VRGNGLDGAVEVMLLNALKHLSFVFLDVSVHRLHREVILHHRRVPEGRVSETRVVCPAF